MVKTHLTLNRIISWLQRRINKYFFRGTTLVLQCTELKKKLRVDKRWAHTMSSHTKHWIIGSNLFVVKALIKVYMAFPSFARITASKFSSRTFLLFWTLLKILSASLSTDFGTLTFWRMDGLLSWWCSGRLEATAGFFD